MPSWCSSTRSGPISTKTRLRAALDEYAGRAAPVRRPMKRARPTRTAVGDHPDRHRAGRGRLLGGWSFAVLVAADRRPIMYVEWSPAWSARLGLSAWNGRYGFVYCLLPGACRCCGSGERRRICRALDSGFDLLIWVFLVVWATDIGAYFAGRAIGGPKLAPVDQPQQDLAGLVGGVVSAAVLAGLWVELFRACRSLLLWLARAVRRRRPARRPVRKLAEAPGRRQGQRDLAARPWRAARPARRAGAGRGPDRRA